MTYRADIDGLRALAVLLVLVFHFDLVTIGAAGFIGVDVFFVISGFLITAIIRSDLELGKFRIGEFLYRRVRRLYPALIATLLLTLLVGWFLFLPYRFAELASQTLLSLLYVVNFHFWQNINYFALRADHVPLLHMWSLAVEEQFYIFFPLVIMGIWRWFPKLLVPAVVCATLVSFGLSLWLTPTKPELSFYLLPTRAWELLLGALLALAVNNRTPNGVWLKVMGPIGLALIAASIFLYSPLTLVPGWFALLPTLGAVALILGGFDRQAIVTKLMVSIPMVWLGKISYPLYLIHWPIRIYLQEHVVEFTYGWRLLGFVLSFALAAAIYYLIETPIRHGKVLSGRGRYIMFASGMSLALIAVSAVILRTDGVPNRFVPEVSEILAYRNDTPAPFQRCGYLGPTVDEMCTLGNKDAPKDVLVIGDSHALALSGALDLWLGQDSRGGVLGFYHGCMPVIGAGATRCQAAIEKALKLAEQSPEVTEVILVSIWRQSLPEGGRPFDGRWVPEEDVADVFAARLEETLNRLRAAGKEVTLIEPLFAASGNVPQTLASNLAFGRDRPVDTPLHDHLETFSTLYDAFDAVEGDGVRRISIIDPFCTDGRCKAILDGRPLFTDNNHLAFSHAPRIAQILANQ